MVDPDRHSPRPAPACACAVGARRCVLAVRGAAAGCGCATPASSRSATSRSPASPRPRRRRSRAALEAAALRHDHAARARRTRCATRSRSSPRSRASTVQTRLPAQADASRCSSASPVAALETGGRPRSPVTGDGRRPARRHAPTRPADASGSTRAAPASRVTDRRTLGALAVAGAAPARLLRAHPTRSSSSAQRLTLDAARRPRPGLRLDAATRARSGSRPPASWPIRAPPGATYLDLRIPERVAAGGLGAGRPGARADRQTPNPQPVG